MDQDSAIDAFAALAHPIRLSVFKLLVQHLCPRAISQQLLLESGVVLEQFFGFIQKSDGV